MNNLWIAVLSITLGADEPAGKVEAPKAADGIELREAVAVGKQVQTRLHLIIRGKIRTDKSEESMAGQALLEYPERVLEIGADGMPKRVARYYSDARAKFVVGKNEDARQLRPNLRLVAGERSDAAMVLWAPGGPLTGDERELIEDVLETSRLPGLLPKQAVKVGETWEPDPSVLQALFDLDNFSQSDVKCTLDKVAGGKATIKAAGLTQGLNLGAEVKSKLDAELTFNQTTNMIEAVVWNQNDSRGPSPVSPPGTYEVRIAITRSAATAKELGDDVVNDKTLTAGPASKLILFEDPAKRFRFFHDRNWHVTVNRNESAVLRRMEKGEFITQLNVVSLADRAPGNAMSQEEFQTAVERAGGWKIDQIIKVDNLPTDGTFQLQLMNAVGKAGELKLVHKHYLATSKSGKQVVFSFILEPGNEEKLGTNDLSLASTVEFLEQTAAKEAGTQK